MTTRSQTTPPVLVRAALGGLAVGAAVSSLLGPRIFAGFAAVALAVGVVLSLRALGTAGRFLPIFGGLLVMLFPLAVVNGGEGGILLAAAASILVLGGGFAVHELRPGILKSLAGALAVVLHLGLLGSYLVLAAAAGNRLLPALVLMVSAFELPYGLMAAGRRRPAMVNGRRVLTQWIDPKAAFAGLVACQAAALATRFLLPAPPGVVSLLVLGGVVGIGAIVGHASAVAVTEDLQGRRDTEPVLSPAVFPHVNSLLFAAGAFYYGFQLYLT